jgi:hypothetical protein
MVRRLCKAASKSRFFKPFGAQTGLELVANQVWQNETNLFRHIDMSGTLSPPHPPPLLPRPIPHGLSRSFIRRLASCRFLERVFLDGYVSLGIVESVRLGGKEIETVRNVMPLRESFESTF